MWDKDYKMLNCIKYCNLIITQEFKFIVNK